MIIINYGAKVCKNIYNENSVKIIIDLHNV